MRRTLLGIIRRPRGGGGGEGEEEEEMMIMYGLKLMGRTGESNEAAV